MLRTVVDSKLRRNGVYAFPLVDEERVLCGSVPAGPASVARRLSLPSKLGVYSSSCRCKNAATAL